jgi:hypothetical protein
VTIVQTAMSRSWFLDHASSLEVGAEMIRTDLANALNIDPISMLVQVTSDSQTQLCSIIVSSTNDLDLRERLASMFYDSQSDLFRQPLSSMLTVIATTTTPPSTSATRNDDSSRGPTDVVSSAIRFPISVVLVILVTIFAIFA